MYICRILLLRSERLLQSRAMCVGIVGLLCCVGESAHGTGSAGSKGIHPVCICVGGGLAVGAPFAAVDF